MQKTVIPPCLGAFPSYWTVGTLRTRSKYDQSCFPSTYLSWCLNHGKSSKTMRRISSPQGHKVMSLKHFHAWNPLLHIHSAPPQSSMLSLQTQNKIKTPQQVYCIRPFTNQIQLPSSLTSSSQPPLRAAPHPIKSYGPALCCSLDKPWYNHSCFPLLGMPSSLSLPVNPYAFLKTHRRHHFQFWTLCWYLFHSSHTPLFISVL